MNILEAVAKWYGCPYGLKTCKDDCENYFLVDPRTNEKKGVGPGTKGMRTLCSLIEDLNTQVMAKTNDIRVDKSDD